MQHAKANGYVEAEAVLADGKVTREEWATLHSDWVSCETKLGMVFQAPLLDPVNGREYMEARSYQGTGAGPNAAKSKACDDRYDYSVGQLYYDDNPAEMAPALLAATRACLKQSGIPYTGRETKLQDFFPGVTTVAQQASAAHSPTWACVSNSAKKLYPQLTEVGFGF